MQIVVVIIVFLVVIGAFALARSRKSNDGVEGFRRQIDALSSDARRPTIDRRIVSDANGGAEGLAGQPDSADAGPTDTTSGADAGDPPDTPRHPVSIDPGFLRAPTEPPDEPADDPADQSHDESAEAGTPEDDPNGA